jgi:hypothetical protein
MENDKDRDRDKDKEKKANPNEQLDMLIDNYLANNPAGGRADGKQNEVEIRFGSDIKKQKISQIDYENVVKKLYSCGFILDNPEGTHSLRIFHEYTDKTTGAQMMSNIRTEIIGIVAIKEYCKTNNLQTILNMPGASSDSVVFTQKTKAKSANGSFINPADFKDFNIRVSYQLETDHRPLSNIVSGITRKWQDSKKTFRHMNRIRFRHDTLPFYADLSIVRKSKTTNGGIPMKFYTIQDAGVFTNPETYEIEIEINNYMVGVGTDYDTVKAVTDSIRKIIRIVMGGIQGTNYPISYTVANDIKIAYMKLLHGAEYQPGRIQSRDFVGPSSQTLQIHNIIELNDNLTVPNIRKNYTVTDKADGDRKLLFINDKGYLYMIDTNMNVVFTGAQTNNKDLYDSLLDGEHIKTDKLDNAINLYAAFDIYYINKKSTREYAFYNNVGDVESNKQKYRVVLLKQFIDLLKLTKTCDFTIKCKMFYSDSASRTIFDGCSQILSDIKDGIYEYNADGLIFTPANTAVASDVVGVAGKLNKPLWAQSFKWKPVEYNTIDFLVSIKKDKSGKDEVHNIFQDGQNLQGHNNIIQYKTVILRCGYDERDKRHGYLNPFEDVVQGKYDNTEMANEDGYKPVPFQPTNPYDPNAQFANIILREDGSRELSMFTKEGEYFEEDMIVEFSYDMTKPVGWRWVPLRARYDKTAELRSGQKNYGNAYHVANNNWQSIHQPVTEDMISKAINIPEYIEECGEEENGDANEGVYYNRTGNEKKTQSLRDFHNLYVKNKLIKGVANRNDILIDYAVGKAGDMAKWIYANLSFVLGIDISRDNIHNRIDGACARYLTNKRTTKNMPGALFINGNSGNNIRRGDAFTTQKDKEIANAVFGNGPKDAKFLGEGVYRRYGVGHDGFNISSCQFALHYFLESNASLHRFIRNLAECTKRNGYFIGTCFDGKTIFKLLEDKDEGGSFTIMNDEKKIFELTKMYSQTGFPDDETCVGYPINVYQETIGKTFREYLVNFDYLMRIMEDYGFVLVNKEKAIPMGLPNGSGLFGDMFRNMESETKNDNRKFADYKNAHLMTVDEKQISFMNRYFVFQKLRDVNAEKIGKLVAHKTVDELELPLAEAEEEKETAPKKITKVQGEKVTISDEVIKIKIKRKKET